MLSAGFHDVPKGHVTTVVTYLEMTSPSQRAAREIPDLSLVLHDDMDPEHYRSVFRKIGQDYLWFSRLSSTNKDLASLFRDPDYHLYTLQRDGQDLGLMELDFRQTGECELAFFGLDAALIGTGAGRFLMTHAITNAFARPITRLHVHTCTLDSPQALGFYIRSGFTPYKQQIEIAADPRLTGQLTKTAAPQIPMFP